MGGARWCRRPPKGAALLPLHYFFSVQFFVCVTDLPRRHNYNNENCAKLCFVFPRYANVGGPKFVPPPSKPWRRPCQGESMKVKFVYNQLTSENGWRRNQISHHLQKKHTPHLYKLTIFNHVTWFQSMHRLHYCSHVYSFSINQFYFKINRQITVKHIEQWKNECK